MKRFLVVLLTVLAYFVVVLGTSPAQADEARPSAGNGTAGWPPRNHLHPCRGSWRR